MHYQIASTELPHLIQTMLSEICTTPSVNKCQLLLWHTYLTSILIHLYVLRSTTVFLTRISACLVTAYSTHGTAQFTAKTICNCTQNRNYIVNRQHTDELFLIYVTLCNFTSSSWLGNNDAPSWTMYFQVMTFEEAEALSYNPFDLTKVNQR